MTDYKDTILKGIKENMTDEQIILALMSVYGVTLEKLPEDFEKAIIEDIAFLKENPEVE
jgi:hypothetical protein